MFQIGTSVATQLPKVCLARARRVYHVQEVSWKQTAKLIRRSGILRLEDGFEEELEREWAMPSGGCFD